MDQTTKIIIDILTLLIKTGLGSSLIYIFYRWIMARIHNQKLRSGIFLVANAAKVIVAKYANSQHVPLAQRKAASMQDLQVVLNKHGHSEISVKYIADSIEAAYQDYKSNGGDVHLVKDSIPNDEINPAPISATKKEGK